jgi:Uma2 family endonuclease
MDPHYSGPDMEARSTSGGGGRRVLDVAALLAEDPFFYGWRWVGDEQVPLTEDDLLDPQEGDHVSDHTLHQWVVRKICEMLEELFLARGRLDVLVGGNLKMLWREPRIKRVAPDALVIPGVDDPRRDRKSFDEKKEGTRPVFVLEATSEATSRTDFEKKPRVYEQAGVEEYFLLDTLVAPWTLTGRRLQTATGRYREIRPDGEGRLLAESLEVLFAIGADGRSVDLFDARSGDKLRDLHAAEKARRVEAEARRLAEQRQRAEAEARRLAEQRQRAAEEEIRRLEALLSEAKNAG